MATITMGVLNNKSDCENSSGGRYTGADGPPRDDTGW